MGYMLSTFTVDFDLMMTVSVIVLVVLFIFSGMMVESPLPFSMVFLYVVPPFCWRPWLEDFGFSHNAVPSATFYRYAGQGYRFQ